MKANSILALKRQYLQYSKATLCSRVMCLAFALESVFLRYHMTNDGRLDGRLAQATCIHIVILVDVGVHAPLGFAAQLSQAASEGPNPQAAPPPLPLGWLPHVHTQ
jgi:hypothetical protein